MHTIHTTKYRNHNINPIPRCMPPSQLISRWGGGGRKFPPSNFVIFKDKDLKFGGNFHCKFGIKVLILCILGHKKVIKQQLKSH